MMKAETDILIIGAGAAGLFCAIEAAKRGRGVVVLERAARIGEKIRISGGGRCNFTNMFADRGNFISQNPEFCRSALARFTPTDFIRMVERHGIKYHEKEAGQLFCDTSSREIIDMLIRECGSFGVKIETGCEIARVSRDEMFRAETSLGEFHARSLVVATGGLSIPRLGATNFGYALAKQFGLRVTPLGPGLVPLLFGAEEREAFHRLSGISFETIVTAGSASFRGKALFTHRGLTGPAILQISSYWEEGAEVLIDFLPDVDVAKLFRSPANAGKKISPILSGSLPKRLATAWCEREKLDRTAGEYAVRELSRLEERLHGWSFVPAGTEGFGKAEVTTGGVDTEELSSKTMEAKKIAGLYFIGEVVDVTGWLGGYNFQWAWSSGWAAGQYC